MKRLYLIIFTIFLCIPLITACVLDGECIEGNCQNGQGTFASQSGYKYIGQFKDGMMHGEGTLIHSNGSKHEGQFKNDMMHGQGITTFSDGGKYEGQSKDDKPFDGSYTKSDGSIIEIRNGQRVK